MADDTVIRASTVVDVAGAKAGLAILQEQYRTTTADIRQSVNRVVDAEKQAAEAIAAGHASIAAALQAAARTERSELDQLITKQMELKAALDAATSSQMHQVSQMAAASGTIRVFEGTLPIRAVENFATKILGLGPILQAAFPVIGAIALAEAVYTVYERFTKVSEAEKKATEDQKHWNAEVKNSTRELEALDLQLEKLRNGSLGAAKQAVENAGKNLQDAIREAQNESQKLHGNTQKIGGRDVILPAHPQSDTATKQAQASITAGEKVMEATKKLEIAQAELDNAATEQKKKAYQEALNALRTADEEYIQELKLAGGATLGAIRSAVLGQIEAARAYPAEVKRLNGELITLQREQATAIERVVKHGEEVQKKQEEAAKKDLDYWKKYFAELAKLADEDAAKQEQHARNVAEIRSRAQSEISESTARSGGQVEDLRIQQQKLELEQAYGLQLLHTHTQEIQYQQQIAALDAQARAAKLAGVQAEQTAAAAALYMANAKERAAQSDEDVTKAVQDQAVAMKKIVELQRQISILTQQNANAGIQQQTKVLGDQLQTYRVFWSQVSAGSAKVANDILTANHRWAADLGQILTHAIDQFAQMEIKRVVSWLAGTAAIQTAETALMGILQSLHLVSAATAVTTGLTESQALIQAAAQLAGANAVASTAAIPFIGPELAPAAGAATFAVAESFAAFESGTGYVPNTGVALVHQGERIIGARQNQQITQALTNGGAGGGHTFNTTINAGSGVNGRQIAKDFHSTVKHLLRTSGKVMA